MMFVITLPKNFYARLAMGVLVLFALLDAWNFLSSRFFSSGGDFLKFSALFRIVFEIVAVGILWKDRFKCTRPVYRLLWIAFLLAGSSTLGFMLFQMRFPFAIPFSNFLICLNKYLFVFVCFYFLTTVFFKASNAAQRSIFQLYEFIVYGNSLFALTGMTLGVWWLRAYPESDRWGYQGIFTFGVEATFFCIIALFYGVAVWSRENRKLPYIAAMVSCVLSGAKAAWALMLVINIWFLWTNYPRVGRFLLTATIVGVVAFINPLIEKISEVPAIAFFFELADKGYTLEKIIFSSRNELMEQAWLNMSYWGGLNYLFGGGGLVTWGIGLPKSQTLITEMDVFDVPLFFGIVGTVLYLKGYLSIFRTLHPQFRRIFVFSFLLLACLGGHVFNSSMNALYLVLFLLKTQEKATPENPPAIIHAVYG